MQRLNDSIKQLNTAFVILDLSRDHEDRSKYMELPASDKIKLLGRAIEKACKQLEKKAPNDMWIVCWPEHGVTEKDSQFVTLETKKELKKEMEKITAQYKQLVVFAGTMKGAREIKDAAKQQKIIDQMKKNYNAMNWEQYEQLKRARKDLYDWLKYRKSNSVLTILRNTAFVFQGGKVILKRSKTFPWRETCDEPFGGYERNFIFHPGRPNNAVYTLTHPSGQKISVALEICAEHSFGALTHDNSPSLQQIHIILSDAIRRPIEKYCNANVVLNADTSHPNLYSAFVRMDFYVMPFESIINNQFTLDVRLSGKLPLNEYLKQKDWQSVISCLVKGIPLANDVKGLSHKDACQLRDTTIRYIQSLKKDEDKKQLLDALKAGDIPLARLFPLPAFTVPITSKQPSTGFFSSLSNLFSSPAKNKAKRELSWLEQIEEPFRSLYATPKATKK